MEWFLAFSEEARLLSTVVQFFIVILSAQTKMRHDKKDEDQTLCQKHTLVSS